MVIIDYGFISKMFKKVLFIISRILFFIFLNIFFHEEPLLNAGLDIWGELEDWFGMWGDFYLFIYLF